MWKLFNSVSNFAGLIGGWLVYLLGGWDNLLAALIVLMTVDYLSGVLKAICTKELSSKTGLIGIVKKFYMLLIVCVAVICEKIGIPAMREVVIMFFVANEGISILENATKIGLPIPEQIKNTLLQIRESKNTEKKE